jgi:probable HAF family extracellular repeat protein
MSTHRRTLMMAVGVLLSGCGDAARSTSPSESPALVPGKNAGTGISITNLGLGRAEDIDDAGRIVGSRGPSSGPLRAFLWTPTTARATTGSFSDLGDLGGGAAQARGINASGQVVGSSTTLSGSQNPFLWEGGSMHDLGIAPAGSDFAEAMDVNDAATRRVAGGVASPVDHAVVWTVSGSGAGFSVTARDVLPGLPGTGSFAFALNDAGVVVGYSNQQPVFWNNSGSRWEVNPLLLPPNAVNGEAHDINLTGSIVGFYRLALGPCTSRAVVWGSPTTPATELPMLSGGTCAEARAINDAGQISGFARDGHFRGRAVLWQPSGSGGYSVTELGLKGGTLAQVLGMNEPLVSGTGVEVVGYAQSPNRDRAILWTLP